MRQRWPRHRLPCLVKDVYAADAIELVALQVECEAATADALGLIPLRGRSHASHDSGSTRLMESMDLPVTGTPMRSSHWCIASGLEVLASEYGTGLDVQRGRQASGRSGRYSAGSRVFYIDCDAPVP